MPRTTHERRLDAGDDHVEHLLRRAVVVEEVNPDDPRELVLSDERERPGQHDGGVVDQSQGIGDGAIVRGRGGERRDARGAQRVVIGALAEERQDKAETLALHRKEQRAHAAEVLRVGDCSHRQQRLKGIPHTRLFWAAFGCDVLSVLSDSQLVSGSVSFPLVFETTVTFESNHCVDQIIVKSFSFCSGFKGVSLSIELDCHHHRGGGLRQNLLPCSRHHFVFPFFKFG